MNQKVKKLRRSLVAVIILAAVAGFTSCEKFNIPPVVFDPLAIWHFQADIQPIFNANCVSCHGGTRSPDLRDGKSYTALKTVYVAAPAESSRLYLKMTGSTHISHSTEIEKLKVLNWIKQGALNN
ncbi:MAG: hypothetical protein C0408_07780 [Odoribacter sp.]|nr:hypothetical protein [Odoribacter sp.]